MLHNERELFEQVILRTAEGTGINAAIIEKDYYVTLFLKEIVKVCPNIIFKGGTSLSKCFKLIDRFSEDIDLNIYTEDKVTEGQRKQLKGDILNVIDSLGFILMNPEDVRSRRSYNRYIIDYPSVFGTQYLKEHLVVETSVYVRSYPSKLMTAASLIYEYLKRRGFEELIMQYDLEPFELKVQSAERTLIDKVYALEDYYLGDRIIEHSRHIYDIYKLLEIVALDDHLKLLAKDVAEERKVHPACLSAQEGINIKVLLQELIDKKIYKEDYEAITAALLFEKVDYAEAVVALQKIIDSDILD